MYSPTDINHVNASLQLILKINIGDGAMSVCHS